MYTLNIDDVHVGFDVQELLTMWSCGAQHQTKMYMYSAQPYENGMPDSLSLKDTFSLFLLTHLTSLDSFTLY